MSSFFDTLPPGAIDSGEPERMNGAAARVIAGRDYGLPERLPLRPAHIEAQEFPVAMLGGVLADAANAIAERVQCPGAIAAQSVLSAAALAVQAHFDAYHPATESVPCGLYLITLADSGERKTSADKYALRRVQVLQDAARDFYDRAYAGWKSECEAREASRKSLKNAANAGAKGKPKPSWQDLKAALDEIGSDPEEPLHPNRILSDPNAEALIKHGQHAPGALLWSNSEAGQLLGGVAMNNENRLRLMAVLSRFWDGQTIDRIRAGDGFSALTGRRLTLHWMLQPIVAAPFLNDPVLRAQGIFSRALITRPASRIGLRPLSDCPVDFEGRMVRYENRLEELLQRDPRCGARANELQPAVLPWAPEALALWREFYDETERQQGAGLDLCEHRGFASKLAENTARIATVLQAFNSEEAGKVTGATMAAAVEIAQFYLSEAIRLQKLSQWDAQLQRADEVCTLLFNPQRWAFSHVSVASLMQRGPGSVRNKSDAKDVLTILREYGYLAKAPEPAQFGKDKSKEAWRILRPVA